MILSKKKQEKREEVEILLVIAVMEKKDLQIYFVRSVAGKTE